MRKLKNKRYHFSMVEIVLAIAILAFGFASVLGLFPVAIKTVKATQTESVVSDAVEDLNAYFRTTARVPLMDTAANQQLDKEHWYALLFYERSGDFDPVSQADIASKYPDYYSTTGSEYLGFYEESNLVTLRNNLSSDPQRGQNFLNGLKTTIASFAPSDNVREKLSGEANFNLLLNLDLFQPDPQKTDYYLIRGDEKFNKIDVSAQIILWKSKMQQVYSKGDSYVSTGKDYKYGVVLNMEVSWPIYVPYSEREKRYYQFTIANPKKRL